MYFDECNRLGAVKANEVINACNTAPAPGRVRWREREELHCRATITRINRPNVLAVTQLTPSDSAHTMGAVVRLSVYLSYHAGSNSQSDQVRYDGSRMRNRVRTGWKAQ